MTRYEVEFYGYGYMKHKYGTYKIDAPDDDAMRKTIIERYGDILRDPRSGCSIIKEGSQYYYGEIDYHFKRWYWKTKMGSGFDWEINPYTGGKMNRYIEGYDVEYVKDGKNVKKHLAFEGIEFTRYTLMAYETYRGVGKFKISKGGKPLGTLYISPKGKWIWKSAKGTEYYLDVNGTLTSQIRK